MSQKSTLREYDNASFLSPQAVASPREETDQFTLPSESKRFMKQTSDPSQLPFSFINDTARLNLDSQEPFYTQNNKWTTEGENFQDQDPMALMKRLDRSNKSILKTTGSTITPKRKTVTIHDENKEISDRDSQQSDAVPARIPTPALPIMGQAVSEPNTFQRLKTFFQRRVKRSDSDLSSDSSKFDPLQPSGPEMEQLRCLNSNLNEWESDQEKATRLRSRRKRSLKGSFVTPARKRAPVTGSIAKYNGLGQQLTRWQIWKLNTLRFLKKNRLVLPPDGRVRLTWDLLGMVFILYEVIMIPLQISFTFDEGSFLSAFSTVIDVFFMSDLLLNFNTGYYQRGHLVVDRSDIASNYLKSWFVLDLLASFPYTYILDAAGVGDSTDGTSSRFNQSTRIIRILRFFRFIRVLRLIRVLKLKNIFGKLESFINLSPALNMLAGFLRLSAIILFIAHWIACIWHLIGDLENGSSVNTWLIYIDMQDAAWSSRYVASIYWAITTMITVGYGDIVPVTDLERIYVIITMLLSSGIFAYSMNSINALLVGWNSENEEFK